jgi:hypothetical protein
MPPPPPPSASYSLVIHDSSSEDEYDDDDFFNDSYFNRKQSIISRPEEAKLVVVPPVKSNNTTATLLSKEEVITLSSSLDCHHHLDDQNQRLRKQLDEIGALPLSSTTSSSTMNITLPPTSAPQYPVNDSKFGDGREEEDILNVVLSNDDIMQSPPTKKKKSKRNKKNKKKMKKRIILDALDEEESNEEGIGSEGCDELVIPKAEEAVTGKDGNTHSIANSDGPSHHSTADDGAITLVEDARAVDDTAIDTPKSPPTWITKTLLSNVMPKEKNRMNDHISLNNATNHDTTTKLLLQPTKARSTKKSVSFSTVSVREYARMIGTHVVPADGGWPLGLSNVVVTEYNKTNSTDNNNTIDEMSSPPAIARIRTDDDIEKLMSWIDNDDERSQQGHHRIRARSESVTSLPSSVAATSLSTGSSAPSSPSSAVTTQQSRRISWTVDDFESRRQTELRQRYAQLIRDRRRRKFEVEWEKKHMNVFQKQHSQQYTTRKSINGGGGSRTRSSSFKMEMTTNDKEELDALVNRNIAFPTELESRPFDYKRRVLIKSKGKGSCIVAGNDHLQGENVKHAVTEEDELYHEYGGRNPLFRTMREDERRKTLHRDDHLMSTFQYCQVIDDGAAATEDEKFALLDPTNTVITQRVQHDLETLRSRRSDPANLGCACRKLQIFFPKGSSSSNKRKSSHRRLSERKVQEELRKRGLLHGVDMSSSTFTREGLEIMLHDAIEKEPCCWGTNCPCWRDGIGCQSETCSCWHGSDSSSSTTKAVDESVLKSRCGNPNGIYFVNFYAIKQYRDQYLSCAPIHAG